MGASLGASLGRETGGGGLVCGGGRGSAAGRSGRGKAVASGLRRGSFLVDGGIFVSARRFPTSVTKRSLLSPASRRAQPPPAVRVGPASRDARRRDGQGAGEGESRGHEDEPCGWLVSRRRSSIDDDLPRARREEPRPTTTVSGVLRGRQPRPKRIAEVRIGPERREIRGSRHSRPQGLNSLIMRRVFPPPTHCLSIFALSAPSFSSRVADAVL